jgi:hypothetical protein
MIRMQAQTILHSMYIEDIRGQLQGKEEKKKKGIQTSRINMDVMNSIGRYTHI